MIFLLLGLYAAHQEKLTDFYFPAAGKAHHVSVHQSEKIDTITVLSLFDFQEYYKTRNSERCIEALDFISNSISKLVAQRRGPSGHDMRNPYKNLVFDGGTIQRSVLERIKKTYGLLNVPEETITVIEDLVSPEEEVEEPFPQYNKKTKELTIKIQTSVNNLALKNVSVKRIAELHGMPQKKVYEAVRLFRNED